MRVPKPPSSAGDVSGSRTDRPQRADARRNRLRILAAAEAVFAEKGTAASTEEIARRAEVGIGTVFRHFPTKEALIEAIMTARIERLVEDTAALATSDNPAAGFFALFTRLAEEAEAKQTYAELLAGNVVDIRRVAPDLYQRLRENIGALLAHAQGAGAVRSDIGVTEVTTLLAGAVHVAESAGPDHALRDRTLAVILDGLRPAQHR